MKRFGGANRTSKYVITLVRDQGGFASAVCARKGKVRFGFLTFGCFKSIRAQPFEDPRESVGVFLCSERA